MKFSDLIVSPAELVSEQAVTEFSDSVDVAPGRTANHGMVGNVKVVRIKDDIAEVIDRNGKHLKLQLSSLHPGEMHESTVTELSTPKLGKYKTSAAKQASAADKAADAAYKAGDVATGKQLTAKADKRFGGIMTATKKQFMNDTKQPVTEATKVPTAKQVEAAKAKYDGFGLKIENAKKKAGYARGTGVVGDLQRKQGQAYDAYRALKTARENGLSESALVELDTSTYQNYIKTVANKPATSYRKAVKQVMATRSAKEKIRQQEVDAKARSQGDPRVKQEKSIFPHDVDHMNGPIIRNHSMATDNVQVDNLRDWERAVNSINSKLFDDECEYVSNARGKFIRAPSGAIVATWNARTQQGWFNSRGQAVRPIHEGVDAAALHVGDPVRIVGNVQGAGETGVFVDAGVDGKFVVIRLDSDDTKHSYHSSDVEYYEGDGEDEDDYYESVTELAMPYSEFKDHKLWSSVARKAGHTVEPASNGRKLQAYDKHGDKVGTYDMEAKKGHIAGSSTNEAHKLGDKVTITKGPKDVVGKSGHIGEIRSGAFKGAAKTYTVDHDGGSIQLSKTQFTGEKGKKAMKESVFETALQEALTEARIPLDGHPYHKKSDTELKGIIKDAGQSARDFKGEKSEAKYLDQVNDASTVLHHRAKQSGLKDIPESAEPHTNFAVDIDGKTWKVFGDETRAKNIARSIMQKYASKKVSVHPTSSTVTEAKKPAAPTVRNPVARAAQTVATGSGWHKDKKRAAKQGDAKHKSKLDEQNIDESDLLEISKDLRDRYVDRAASAHGGYNMARRNTQGTDQEHWARKERNTKQGISRALSDERLARDQAPDAGADLLNLARNL